MSKTYTERICYRNGIVKPENKVLELHAFCDCDKCKIRRKSVNHGLRNVLTVTVEKMELDDNGNYVSTTPDSELGKFVYACLWHPLDHIYHYSDRFKNLFKSDWRNENAD